MMTSETSSDIAWVKFASKYASDPAFKAATPSMQDLLLKILKQGFDAGYVYAKLEDFQKGRESMTTFHPFVLEDVCARIANAAPQRFLFVKEAEDRWKIQDQTISPIRWFRSDFTEGQAWAFIGPYLDEFNLSPVHLDIELNEAVVNEPTDPHILICAYYAVLSDLLGRNA